jgi:hypothetical protein
MFPFWLGRIAISFTLLFGHHLFFWEMYFHKIKGRETPSRSYNNSSTTENFSASTELCNALWEFKIAFEISSDF